MSQDKARFHLPDVFLGDNVLWKHSAQDDDGEAAVAIVTKIGDHGSLGLTVMAPDSRVGSIRDGVLHANDPRNLTRVEQTNGVWVHTERTTRIMDTLAALEISVLTSQRDEA